MNDSFIETTTLAESVYLNSLSSSDPCGIGSQFWTLTGNVI